MQARMLVDGATCYPRLSSSPDLVATSEKSEKRDDAVVLLSPAAKQVSPAPSKPPLPPNVKDRSKEEKEKPAQPATTRWLGLGLTALVSVMYMGASAIAILVNRHLLVDLDFPYPVTITWLGLVTTTLFSAIGVHAWLPTSSRKGVSMQYYLTHVMPCGFFMAVAFLTGNMSFMYLTLAFVQMLKASTPIVTMLLLFAFQLEKATTRLIVSVCIICLGVCVAGYGEVRVSIIGLACMLTSVGAESLRLVLMQFLMDPKGGELHPIEGVMYISSACMLWLLAQAMIWEWSTLYRHNAYMKIVEKPGPFVVAASAGFAVNMLAILVIKRASSLTLKVLGTVKDVALVMVSVLVLREQVGHLQLIGYMVSLAGFVLYNVAKAHGSGTDAGQGGTAPNSVVKLA